MTQAPRDPWLLWDIVTGLLAVSCFMALITALYIIF